MKIYNNGKYSIIGTRKEFLRLKDLFPLLTLNFTAGSLSGSVEIFYISTIQESSNLRKYIEVNYKSCKSV